MLTKVLQIFMPSWTGILRKCSLVGKWPQRLGGDFCFAITVAIPPGKLITRGERAISIALHIEKMRKEQSIPRCWIFMVGADSDRLAIENSSWSTGAFTHCLIEALSGQADGFESVGPKDGTVTMREIRGYLNSVMPNETQRILGVAKRPVITTSTGDPNIWNLSLEIRQKIGAENSR